MLLAQAGYTQYRPLSSQHGRGGRRAGDAYRYTELVPAGDDLGPNGGFRGLPDIHLPRETRSFDAAPRRLSFSVGNLTRQDDLVLLSITVIVDINSAVTPAAMSGVSSMPTYARRQIVVEDQVGVCHCIARCVRRAFLCGLGPYSGQDYSHRKEWILDRLRELAGLFAIEVCGYSVMSNHLHLVLRNRPDIAGQWSADEIALRWCRVFPPRRPPRVLNAISGAVSIARTVRLLTSSDHPHTTVVSIRARSDRIEARSGKVDALADCSHRRVRGSSWVSGFSTSSWVSGFFCWIPGCLDSWVSGFPGCLDSFPPDQGRPRRGRFPCCRRATKTGDRLGRRSASWYIDQQRDSRRRSIRSSLPAFG